jgi:FixJ family two-component response regulator
MVMPRLGGRKMAAAVAAARPDVRLVFTSGYTDDLSGAEAMGPGVEFLAKPFSAQELAESVRRALDAG